MNWITLECETDIQILPIGEETFHSWDSSCNCCPKISLDEWGKLVYTHSSYDGREILEAAYRTPLHLVRQRLDS